MENKIEIRVNRLENIASKLAKSNELTNEVICELVDELSTEVRKQVKEELVTKSEEIKRETIDAVSGAIDEKVKIAVNERGLNRTEMNKLTKARNVRMRQLLGDSRGDKYILLISFYQGAMIKGYRKNFDCGAYGDIEATRFSEAIDYVNNFDVQQGYYDWAIDILHNQYRDGEIENKKKFNAYERFFGIRVA